MTRPRTVSDQAILDAARDCAIERGPQVSLDVIAERVGVTSPALLKRFGSRQELMIAALRPSAPPAWVRELGDGPDDRPLQAQLEALIDRIFDFFAREMPCMTALSQSGYPLEKIFERGETPPPFMNLWALAEWLRRAQQRGLVGDHVIQSDDFESVALSILGSLHARVFLTNFMGASWWRRSRNLYVADLAQTFASALEPRTQNKAPTLRPVPNAPSRTRRQRAAQPDQKTPATPEKKRKKS